jgi:ATP/maltotriose-dependent transcriptional regulator MalT
MELQLTVNSHPSAPLSGREWEILSLVAAEYSNAQIAQSLVISQNTVKVHLRNIFDKLEVQTRLGAVMVALRQGWLILQPDQVRLTGSTNLL